MSDKNTAINNLIVELEAIINHPDISPYIANYEKQSARRAIKQARQIIGDNTPPIVPPSESTLNSGDLCTQCATHAGEHKS